MTPRFSKRGEEVLARVGAVLSNVKDRQYPGGGAHRWGAHPGATRRLGIRERELSTSRATNVVRFLEDTAHVSPKRLVATGYGSFHPLSRSNATPAGRACNRRIAASLTPALDPAPVKMAVATAEPATRGEGPLARAKPAGKKAKKH